MELINTHPKYVELLQKQEDGEITINPECLLQRLNSEILEIDKPSISVNDIDESKLQWIEVLENLLFLIDFEYVENRTSFDIFADPSLKLNLFNENQQSNNVDILSNPLGYELYYNSILEKYTKAYTDGYYKDEKLINEIQQVYYKLKSLTVDTKHLNPRIFRKSLLRKGLIDFNPENWKQVHPNSFFNIDLPESEIKHRIRIIQILNKIINIDYIDESILNREISQLAVEFKDTISSIKTDFYYPDRKTLYQYGLTSLENLLFVETNKISKSSFDQNGYDNLESIRGIFKIYTETINSQISINSNKSEISKFLLYEKQKNKTMILDNNMKESYIQSLPRLAYYYTKAQLKELISADTIPKETSIVEQEKNPYPEIFPDITSYKLFISLTEEIGKKHSDITFIYRIMLSDKFIHQYSESEFQRWLVRAKICELKSKLQQLDRTEGKGRKESYLLKLNEYQLVSATYSKTVSK